MLGIKHIDRFIIFHGLFQKISFEHGPLDDDGNGGIILKALTSGTDEFIELLKLEVIDSPVLGICDDQFVKRIPCRFFLINIILHISGKENASAEHTLSREKSDIRSLHAGSRGVLGYYGEYSSVKDLIFQDRTAYGSLGDIGR